MSQYFVTEDIIPGMPGVDFLTGNSGGPVGADAAFNINILGSNAQGINIVGVPGTHTLTVSGINATTIQKGVVALATNAEAIAGIDTAKAITSDDLSVKLGLQTTNAIPFGAGISAALNWTAGLTDGQLVIGSTAGAPTVASLSAGTGISITPGSNSITIANTAVGITWLAIAGTPQALTPSTGYINKNAGLTTFTLPAAAAVGEIYEIAGYGAGGWTITENAGQSIHFLGSTTTITTGSLSSTTRYDAIKLLCTVANTEFNVVTVNGNITLV